VQGVAKDLTRRGVRAIEAFGDERWEAPACVLPAEYLRSVGFKTVRAAPPLPAAAARADHGGVLARGRRGRARAAARLDDPDPLLRPV
jgi:hypothetical protein